ncbi:MAG: metallophosphoesterase [Nanoarchaeota archaeon]|nr:metallophosphoesterase [Nanoarchaeota archaeon]
MSKFLYFQDGHIKGKNSINRLGNYFEDWLIKFNELLSIAKENNVSAILDGGDILDSPEPSYRILDEIADRIEKTKIPMYSLFGNHAQKYASNEHSKYTGLAHLQKRSEYFKYLDHPYLKHGQQRVFSIKGIEYSNNIEEDIKKNGIVFDKKFHDCWKVAIVHAFVCPKEFPYASHVVCDDIKTNADLVLVAHYHSQWEKKVGNTQFLDIGCFGRNSITEANIEPSCVLLDTEKRSYEIIKLKSAKKAKKIFDLSKIEEIKEGGKNLEKFIRSIEDTKFQSTSVKDAIKILAKEGKIDKEVEELIFQKMEKNNV